MGTYLSRSQTNGNQDKWTWSGWVKRSTLGSAQCFFATSNGSSNSFDAKFDANDNLDVYNYLNAGFGARLITNRLFRDPSSWYHVVVIYDSGNSTEAQRLRIYVNGTEETSFSTTNYPSINENSDLNVSGSTFDIGRQQNGAQFFNGYLTDINLIDGQALTPSTFGETDSTTGEWKPKVDFTGVTYGTNGFRLQFGNAAALGTDTSGNTNTLTVNNAGTNAKTVDTASNNFITFNPLANKYAGSTFSFGNLKVTMGSSQYTWNATTFGLASGKWYWEVKPLAMASGTDNFLTGVVSRETPDGSGDQLGETESVIYRNNGNSKKDGSNATYGAAFTTSDIVMVALDMDNKRIYFGTNGQWADGSGSNNQANPYSPITLTTTMQAKTFIFPCLGDLSSNAGEPSAEYNFGNPTFSISSSNSDGAGHGSFEYAVPSGYYAICTNNIQTYG